MKGALMGAWDEKVSKFGSMFDENRNISLSSLPKALGEIEGDRDGTALFILLLAGL
jgi:hypothetical protein